MAKFALAGMAVASMLACWSGGRSGRSIAISVAAMIINQVATTAAALIAVRNQKEALRQIDPKLAAAVEKRFRQIEEIEFCDAPQWPKISIYTPDRIWACDVTRNPLKLRCRTRHQ
jgi:hypothetical protein